MSNPTNIYNTFVRANLSSGLTYSGNRYRYGDKSFFSYSMSFLYAKYVEKNSIYNVKGFFPELTLDFTGDYFRTSKGTTTLVDATTFARAGNATMVDSDGLLKWAPHNLQINSEDISDASWGKSNLTAPSSGSIQADAGTFVARASDNLQTKAGFNSLAFVASAGTHEYIWLGDRGVSPLVSATFDVNLGVVIGSSNVTASITDLGNDEYLCSIKYAKASDGTSSLNIAFGDSSHTSDWPSLTWAGTETLNVSKMHAYRSDLGGMVNNPETGDSYVPTTSAAVYLPRQNHHIYNGTAWVNAGLLVEPGSATNLLTYSQDFSNAAWTKAGGPLTVAPSSTETPAGNTTAFTVSGSSSFESLQATSTVVSGRIHSVSFFVSNSDRDVVTLRMASGSSDVRKKVTLTSGSVADAGGNGTGFLSAGSIDVGGGWYRVHVTATSDGTSMTTNFYPDDSSEARSHTVDLWGAQLEEGSVPTSYIPTAGATVARATETLVIPADNLPDYMTPTYIGDELVTNGTFDSDTGGWTDISNAILAVNSGRLEVTADGSTLGVASTPITTVVGKIYHLSVDTMLGTSAIHQVWVGTSNTSASDFNSGSIFNTETVTATFVATATTHYVNLVAHDVDETSLFDNVSVREINPLAVSIQMDGYMTYADTSSSTEAQFYYWRASSSNYIQARIDTLGDRTGGPYFLQNANSTLDTVRGADTEFAAGINVPFNIASRHGSTFINGAAEGTALTANTTPVAVPDLSSTDLIVCGEGGPMIISKFRMWAEDIGDTGIAEASA